MRKRKINPELYDLLVSGRWSDFTVAELKTAYMALPHCPHSGDKAAWQFVYRNIVRMEQRGLISRVAGIGGEKARYQWNAENTADSDLPEGGMYASMDKRGVPDDATLSRLKERLHRYKVEMLSVIGETEEYDAICSELPQMRSAVQALYNDARDRCSKTLGRVRALESILTNQFQQQPS
jgi:hypothetical protein